MKDIITRTLTGIVFVAVVLGAICLYRLPFLIVFSLITVFTLWEFYGLTGHYENARIKRLVNTVGGIYLFISSYAYANEVASAMIYLPYLLFIIGVFVAELYDKNSNPLNNWAFTFFGQVYVAGSFSLLNFITAIPGTPGQIVHTPIYAVAVFVLIWLNDTGAYLVGSSFGRHRLFERISPKKSWEGFFGGFIIALIASQVFAYFVPGASRIEWIGLSATVVIFGTWGDLTESLIKRTLGLKDSGKILPGHGGMLDRFDSVMMAIPATYIFIELFIQN